LEERLDERAKGDLELLCPELALRNLPALAVEEKVLKLVSVRAEHAKECLGHDADFIGSVSDGVVHGEMLQVVSANRHNLVCTFLHDWLTFMHNSPGISAPLPTVGAGEASSASSTREDTSYMLPDLPVAPHACPVLLQTWEGGIGREGGAELVRLAEETIKASPIDQFLAWFHEACPTHVPEDGQHVTLATATPTGFPSARVVILKQVDRRGFVFFTNTLSRKGREMRRNSVAAMVVHWPTILPLGGRQVRVEGVLEAITPEESDEYFYSRSVKSQIGASASPQSQVIRGGREELEALVREVEEHAKDGRVERPSHWGGIRLVPTNVEFWECGEARLHNRLRFQRVHKGTFEPLGGDETRVDADDVWTVERLAP
jgi:pyridoxamine 5'-phosphate oxidase